MSVAFGQDAPTIVAGRRWHERLLGRFAGLKARLALVVALVLLVPTAFAMTQATIEAREAELRQVANLKRLLVLVEGQHRSVLRQSQRLLRSIADGPIGSSDRESCEWALRNEVLQSSLHLAFIRLDSDGVVDCGSRADAAGFSLAEQYVWQELKRGSEAGLSEIRARRAPEPGQTILLAVPIRAQSGGLVGAMISGMALDELIALPRDLALPEGAVAAVVDRLGTVITTRGESRWAIDEVGRIEAGLRARDAPPIVRVAPDGASWRFLVSPSTEPGLFTSVIVGLPIERWSWLDAGFQLGVLLPTLILFLSVFVVWVATDVLVTRHVLALAAAVRGHWRSGAPIEVRLHGAPEELNELAHAFAEVTRRVSDREAQLNASLAEKSMLLREIHHRVKNNLQIVTSLLNLRAGSLQSAPARLAMREAQLRIKSLALVHRSLYEQEEVSAAALDQMLEDLCPLLHELSEDLASRVQLRLELEPCSVSADQATPLALLVTELLSNAAKHAFPDGRDGTVLVRLAILSDGRAALSVADDGVGPAAHGAETGRRGLGTTLVEMLAKQLDAQLASEDASPGWRVTVTFRPAGLPAGQ